MKPVTIDGKNYKTITECMDKTGFSYGKVCRMLKNKIEPCEKVTYRGKTYETIHDFAKENEILNKKGHIDIENAKKIVKANLDIPVKTRYTCFYKKKTYAFNLIEECKEFFKKHKIKKYFNDYDGLLKFFNVENKRKYIRKNKIKFTFEGKDYEFATISEIRKKTRLSFKTISKLIKGEPIKEFYRINAKFCLEQASASNEKA